MVKCAKTEQLGIGIGLDNNIQNDRVTDLPKMLLQTRGCGLVNGPVNVTKYTKQQHSRYATKTTDTQDLQT